MKNSGGPRTEFSEVFIAPHAHFDLTWMGTPEECERINNDIIAAALALLESDPLYRYSIETVRPMELYLAWRPEDKEKAGRFYREGRLEIGGLYSDVSYDYCFDESLARNACVGQLWLERMFGARSAIAREEDVLSHFAQSPQLLAGCGFRRLKISRGPHGLFTWKAPDGTGIVTALFDYNHSYHFRLGRSPELTIKNLPDYLDWITPRVKPRLPALLLMDGDDCTMPGARLSEIVAAWNQQTGRPRLRLATIQEYMDSLPHENLPVRKGDIPGFWVGVMLFELEAAESFRLIEPAITGAEKFSAMLNAIGGPPPEPLDGAWRDLLTAQDHNWGGKDETRRGPEADADKTRMIHSALDIAEHARDVALDGIAAVIRRARPGVPLAIFNPLSWERSDVASAVLPPGIGREIRVRDGNGEEVSCQIHSDPEKPEQTLLSFKGGAPPLGWKTYYVEESASAKTAAPATGAARGLSFENDFYRVELAARRNGIRRVIDKRLGVQIAGQRLPGILDYAAVPFLSFFAIGGRFTVPGQEFYENIENIKNGAQGEGGKFLGKFRGPSHFRAGKVESVDGPVFQRITIRGTFLKCPAELEITMYNEIKRIDFTASIEWGGMPGMFLALLFPFPGGRKSIHVNTPYYTHRIGDEAEGFWRIPGLPVQPKIRGVQNWFSVDIGGSTATLSSPWRVWDFTIFPAALALASDNRGGFFHGDRYLQKGLHRYRFSLFSSAGDWKQAESNRCGVEPMYPLIARFANGGGSGGELPDDFSFCKISPENITITALKIAEDGDGVFVRFYETLGGTADVALEFPFDIKRAALTDGTEQEIEKLAVGGRRVFCPLKPYGICNIKVFFKGRSKQ